MDTASAKAQIQKVEVNLQSCRDPRERAGLLFNKAVLLAMMNHFEEARTHLRLGLAEAADEPSVRFSYDFISASMYDQENLPKQALARLTEVISTHSEFLRSPSGKSFYKDIQLRRAFDSARSGDLRDAVNLCRECLTFDLEKEERGNVLSNLGYCYVRLKDYASGRRYLVEACEVGIPKAWEGQVHLQLGVALSHLKLFAEAKREFLWCESRAVEYKLPLKTIYGWLSLVCRYLGGIEECRKYTSLARVN